MKVNHTHQIVGLRLAVGLLGEQEQSAWWPSGFLGRHAQAFLGPVFGSKTRMAQYHGVTDAACRIHYERPGSGGCFTSFGCQNRSSSGYSMPFKKGVFPRK
jgi:hypothetical protein